MDLRGFRGWAELADQPFLRRLRQGRVGVGAFERWLAQERYLYEGILGLQTALLRQAPQRHRLVLAQAVVITVEELDWMEYLELPDLPLHPARQGYLEFLAALEGEPYAVGTVVHWARQKAVCEAWRSVGPLEGLPGEFSEHWLAPETQALTHDLGSLTLEAADGSPPGEMDAWVRRVLEQEARGWEMGLEFALLDEA